MRRLKENAMLEAEITRRRGMCWSKARDVGELQGLPLHRRPDRRRRGRQGRARAPAQKALARRDSRRAPSASPPPPTTSLALGSRRHAALARRSRSASSLRATDAAEAARSSCSADEQLTGPARDKVAARGSNCGSSSSRREAARRRWSISKNADAGFEGIGARHRLPAGRGSTRRARPLAISPRK